MSITHSSLVRTIESLTRCACRQCFDRDFFLSLEPVGTYLQKVLGDDNVLTVVFEDLQKNSSTCSIDPYSAYKRIAKNGIKIGLRRYQLFGGSLSSLFSVHVTTHTTLLRC